MVLKGGETIMRVNAKERIATVVKAWETLRPEKTFAGFTLTAFKTAVQPSFEARNRVDTLNKQMIAATNQRDDADKKSMRQVLLVVNAVKADLDEGDDGELYKAMGYVRKSDRKSGLVRKTTTTPTPAA
jgi:hypothetical protein